MVGWLENRSVNPSGCVGSFRDLPRCGEPRESVVDDRLHRQKGLVSYIRQWRARKRSSHENEIRPRAACRLPEMEDILIAEVDTHGVCSDTSENAETFQRS